MQWSLQPPRDIQQDPPLVGVPRDRLEHQRMVDTVEERPDVKIYYPVVTPTPLPAATHRVQRGPPRTIAIGVGVKDGFHLPLQVHRRYRLRDPIVHSWHPENPRPSSCFRYCHRSEEHTSELQ